MANIVISLEAITLIRGGRKIFTDFTEVIPRAKITVILGANGSGKSTLLAAMAGYITADKGSVKINDRDISTYSAKQLSKLRAMAIQNQIFTLGFSVRQVIEMAGQADEVIQSLDLSQISQQMVTSLSGGQGQRVAIAQVIAQRTPLLLLDEPLASQDQGSRERIIKLLKEYVAEGGTVVMAAHNSQSELSWADKLIRLEM